MKKFLIVYYGDAPECVEGFHKDATRSCKGALHVVPGRKLTVTEEELEHLKKNYSHMLSKLRILSQKIEAEVKEVVAVAQAEVESGAGEAVKAQEDGGKKKKKKH